MKKQIIRISPFQTAKLMAALYFVMSVPFALLMLAMPFPAGSGMSGWMMIVLPVFYLIFGFIFSIIAAWIYNLVAGQVGGIEFTTVEVAGGDKAA